MTHVHGHSHNNNIIAKKKDELGSDQALEKMKAGGDDAVAQKKEDSVVQEKKDEASLSGLKGEDKEADALDAVVGKKKDAAAEQELEGAQAEGQVEGISIAATVATAVNFAINPVGATIGALANLVD